MQQEGLEGCQEVIGLLDLSIAKALKEGSLMCHKPLPHDSLPARLEAEKQQKLASLHSQITALKQAWHPIMLCSLLHAQHL